MNQAKRGLLFTDPNGVIYHVPACELERFVVPSDKLEETILDAEAHGFVESEQTPSVSTSAAVPQASDGAKKSVPPTTVINIYVGDAPATVEKNGVQVNVGPAQNSASEGAEAESLLSAPTSLGGAGSSMSKYAAGSSMSKYAAGSSMSKYAAGSSMSKYAAGSSMSKYAAGSSMSKYQSGSQTEAVLAEPDPREREDRLAARAKNDAVTFYGDWGNSALSSA